MCACFLDKAAMIKIVTSSIFPTVHAEKNRPINADWKCITGEILTSKDGFVFEILCNVKVYIT